MDELMTVGRIREDEGQFLNEIITTQGANLPAKLDDVLEIFEFTDWKARAWKTLSDKMAKLQDQQEAYHSALRSGQNWGIAALYAQKRMGEITREMPKPQIGGYGGGAKSTLPSSSTKGDTLLDKGISTRSYKDAERIASSPEILERVINQAKESNEIPTKTAVLREIRAERLKSYNLSKEREDREKQKQVATMLNNTPKPVKTYMDAMKLFKGGLQAYKESMNVAMKFAREEQFSPEAKQFVANYHQELKRLMATIQTVMDEMESV